MSRPSSEGGLRYSRQIPNWPAGWLVMGRTVSVSRLQGGRVVSFRSVFFDKTNLFALIKQGRVVRRGVFIGVWWRDKETTWKRSYAKFGLNFFPNILI
jgi:hypothetical protein